MFFCIRSEIKTEQWTMEERMYCCILRRNSAPAGFYCKHCFFFHYSHERGEEPRGERDDGRLQDDFRFKVRVSLMSSIKNIVNMINIKNDQ